MPADRIQVECRPARPEDTEDVLRLTRNIWDGGDYVPYVWNEWLADREGLLAVAEHARRVIGLAKLTRISPEEWWLEGLRTHPDYEGRGVAASLHDYILKAWAENSKGVLRLATASSRLQVQHLCERTGFKKVAEFTSYKAPVLEGQTDNFQLLALQDIPKALDFIITSPSLALSAGLVDIGWQWARPDARHLKQAVERNQARWWKGRDGLLVFREDDEDGKVFFTAIQVAACPLEVIASLLGDYRRLAATLGYSTAYWMAPVDPKLQPALQIAGFQRDWDASIYVYERIHGKTSGG
jgi:GNAT superfamily N-acetyltransferase